MAAAGFTAMHISGFVRLRSKLMWFIAAGPASNLCCTAIVVLFLRSDFGIPFNSYLSSALRLVGGASLFCFIASIVPYRSCNFSDGFRLCMILRGQCRSRRWYAVMGIGVLQRAGRKPRQWNAAG